MPNIAAYGSLRVGEYNFDRINQRFPNSLNYLYTDTIKGFKLIDLGPYPAAIAVERDATIVVDIIECSEDAYKFIEMMEFGAGYKKTIQEVEGDKCTLYTMPIGNVIDTPARKYVKDGDWVKHRKELEQTT
jgi:gamma-glutamylcyclotransferase (GGCT)/AIG2-like uncharacterized protein YtfP